MGTMTSLHMTQARLILHSHAPTASACEAPPPHMRFTHASVSFSVSLPSVCLFVFHSHVYTLSLTSASLSLWDTHFMLFARCLWFKPLAKSQNIFMEHDFGQKRKINHFDHTMYYLWLVLFCGHICPLHFLLWKQLFKFVNISVNDI